MYEENEDFFRERTSIVETCEEIENMIDNKPKGRTSKEWKSKINFLIKIVNKKHKMYDLQ